jgi:phosphatidylglycerophosphate synthase
MAEPGKQAAFRDAARAQTSLLAPLEKPCLIWLAHHTPRWINSDHLTLLGLLAMLGAGVAYWFSRANPAALWVVSACLVVNWYGDSLDGTLARVRARQRPRYGFYVDHVVDALGTLFLLVGLALSGYMSERMALALLIVYFLLSIEVYLATYTLGTFELSHWSFSPTELRLLLIIGNVALLYRPVVTLAGARYRLFDVGGLVGAIGMTAMVLVAVVRHTTALYRGERLP